MGWTAAAAIAGLASAGVGAVGAIQQGQAASKQAKFQSTVMQQQAERERQIAEAKEADYRRDQNRLMAERRAASGATGVEMGTGSPLLATEDFARESELNALRIRNGGEVNAGRLEQQAALYRTAGKNAKTGSYFRAGASLLTGVSSGADLWGRANGFSPAPVNGNGWGNGGR
jgi:hypothetical protein